MLLFLTSFSFMNMCRTGKKGGGVSALFKDAFQFKDITLGNFLSFSFIFILKGAHLQIIYRHPRYSANFIDDIAELRSIISIDYNITGDFSIHIDNMDDSGKESLALLDTFGLCYTLVLVIFKDLDISSVVVKDLALSDHFCVFFLLNITPDALFLLGKGHK